MKKLILTSFVLSLSLSGLADVGKIIEDRSELSIETPALSQRQTRKLILDNGLKAILISDPKTPESGAALAVAVGSWDDPKERPGMAHFVEHMLFLGTEKYPEEEGYTRYLDEHGGSRNAFTMADRTVYMFSVQNGGFSEALDRFGQFFIAPCFNPSGVDRECKAIHQEFCKDLPLDPWRVLYVKKELANKDHPFHEFCIGNSDTLAKISQDELKEWYQNHYSANLMHLVVYSSKDLDTLEKEVLPIFSQVKNSEKSSRLCDDSLLCSSQFGKMIAIAPLQDVQMLELSWEIPRFFGRDIDLHVDKLVSHVLGHEGSTSLLAQLKRENLAEGLGVGTFRAGNDQALLTLSIKLTSKGVADYEKVIGRCFEAISSINQSGIPRFIFDEVKQNEERRYRFQPREEIFNLVSEYAMRMVDEPLETFPRKSFIPTAYSPEKIQEFLAALKPETCQFALIAHPNVTKIKLTQKEKWMGVEYEVLPISQEKLASWSKLTAHESISIPRPNPFIAETLSVTNKGLENTAFPQPQLMVDSPIGKLYGCLDTQFCLPEVAWFFRVKTPVISDKNALTHVMADLFCHAVDEKLNSIAYEASLAGLSYSLSPTHNGLELKISGYSDKAVDFLATIVATLAETRPTREQFALYHEQFKREYANGSNSPLKEGAQLLWSMLYKDYAGVEQKKEVASSLRYEKMQQFCANLFKNCYIEGFLYGNLADRKVWDIFEKSLKCQAYPPSQHEKIELASLPSHEHSIYLTQPSKHPANAVLLTADCGPFSFKKRAAQEILTKGLEEPFFSELRTKQQTGYAVTNWSQEIERHLYSFFAVQSSSHDTRDLLARFELFLESNLQHLSESVIPESRFESIRSALIHKLEHPAENLAKMGQVLHILAFDYDGDFEWLQKRKEGMQELTYTEFTAFAQECFGKENVKRLAVCVEGALPKKGKISYQPATTLKKLKGEIAYRGRSE